MQKQAEELVKRLNPNDKPDEERVRNTKAGGCDQWRAVNSHTESWVFEWIGMLCVDTISGLRTLNKSVW